MKDLRQLHWPLILGMGALALLWPIMHLTHLMDALGRPFGPVLLTVLISMAWLAIVVLGRVRAPVLTVTLTGIVYGAFAILISGILSPIVEGALAGPLTHPVATVSVLVTNALWGLVVGVVAKALQPAAAAEGS